MAKAEPFYSVRPSAETAARVAALPYDVYNREEARRETEREPLSFLRIDRAETAFGPEVAFDDPQVYEKAGELYEKMKEDGTFIRDPECCYYVCELTYGTHRQTGIACCISADDYLQGVVKTHENTREDKEQDRVCHVRALNAQTGPVLLAYRHRDDLKAAAEEICRETPLYDFTAPDGVHHRLFRVSDPEKREKLREMLSHIPAAYIADGHHRAASAVRVAQRKREENPQYTGEEPYNFFLSVLFPDDELQVLSYNRAVRDLNGRTPEEFLQEVQKKFRILSSCREDQAEEAERTPEKRGQFCMLLDGIWYRLEAAEEIRSEDPVDGLDVSLLQNHLLAPVLGIANPRTDERISFIGGIRGTKELEKRCRTDMRVAFSLFPTSLQELFDVADAGRLMPPKSTWFEPKLRSGLLIHELGDLRIPER